MQVHGNLVWGAHGNRMFAGFLQGGDGQGAPGAIAEGGQHGHGALDRFGPNQDVAIAEHARGEVAIDLLGQDVPLEHDEVDIRRAERLRQLDDIAAATQLQNQPPAPEGLQFVNGRRGRPTVGLGPGEVTGDQASHALAPSQVRDHRLVPRDDARQQPGVGLPICGVQGRTRLKEDLSGDRGQAH